MGTEFDVLAIGDYFLNKEDQEDTKKIKCHHQFFLD